MYYGDVMNDLEKSNDYFNKLLYKHIWPPKKIVIKTKENREILGYYYKRSRQKKIYNFIYKHYLRNVLNNFKLNLLSNELL